MDNSDQPNSILHVNQLQMYPIPTSDLAAPPAFPLLCGEGVVHSGHSVDGVLVLTNYRLYLQLCETQHHVPLGLLEIVEHRDLFYLHIGCKDARTYRCTFDNNETCLDWFARLTKASAASDHLEELFAFYFFVWSKQERPTQEISLKLDVQRNLIYGEKSFNHEVDRLKFNLHGTWRISSINKNYKLCGSYPPHILVPAYITDEVLETVAKFRSSRRIPAVVWRHVGNGAVIARCSQPEVGWLGWRSGEDEELIKAMSEACTQDRGPHALYVSTSPPSIGSNEDSTHIQTDMDVTEKKKVLIMDARSYTTAVANRARGGGCECPEYYPSCEIQFMNLANIHSIRKSFHALRQLCTSFADQPNWFSLLEGTRWLQHMSGLMRAAVTLVTAVERDARPVLVHCSDGWDRTPQIVALAELLLDPYYRTVDGFRILIEREWLAFGHKFADRCGHATGSDDQNERCPVFLQWLDCVHQLIGQFPCAFEFSHTYLVKLVQHTYSNLFGTFLCNTKQERENIVNDNTFSVWLFLNTSSFRNHLYTPPTGAASQVLWPQCNVRDLELWSEVYLGSLELNSGGSTSEGATATCPAPPESLAAHNMTKTRSYGDLLHAADASLGHVRRCSDPSLIVDTIKLANLKLTPTTDDAPSARTPEHKSKQLLANDDATTPTNNADFLADLSADENDCKSDCIYKNSCPQDDLSDLLILEEQQQTTTTTADEKKIIEYDLSATTAALKMLNGDERKTNYVIDKTETNGIYLTDNGMTTEGRGGGVVDTDISGDRLHSVEFFVNGNDSTEDLVDSSSHPIKVLRPDAGVNIPPAPPAMQHYATRVPADATAVSAGGDREVAPATSDDDLLFSVCLKNGDINHNGALKTNGATTQAAADVDSDTECTTEPNSDNTTVYLSPETCGGALALRRRLAANSVETSTETLVSENISSSSPKDLNGFENVSNPDIYNGNSDVCKVCAQNIKFIHGKHSHHHSGNTSGKTSRYSTPPLYSRTPSANGWDSTFMYCHATVPKYQCNTVLDDDGLIPLRSDMQERLWQIIDEHRRKVEALQRELHTYRQALIKQVCHKCNHNDTDRNDETSSVVESVCSAGEGQASAVESLRSDMSWEAVEDGPSMMEAVPTLWVPDHAVSMCTGCGTEFWLGRRKHHCRNCGRIFCADCSENSTPLPSEQLYDPVRVCTSCFSKLSRRDCADLPEQCKHGASANNNPHQIAASSN